MANRTVYVIGAGASCEIGMPIGDELKKQIAELLVMKFQYGELSAGNKQLFRAIQHHCSNDLEDIKKYCTECDYISKNMNLAISIDNFIDSNRGNEVLALCGKMGIVEAILKAEKNSSVYFKKEDAYSELNDSKLDGTWYLHLFRTITENCEKEDLKERFSRISLIIFNYDRCIEYVLHNTLAKYFRIPASEAVELVKNIEIIHPYGTVGDLPEFSDNEMNTEYGAFLKYGCYANAAQNINTFTEGGASDDIGRLHGLMKTCDRLIFLGFAFHRLNMSLLMDAGEKPYSIKKKGKVFRDCIWFIRSRPKINTIGNSRFVYR